MPVRVDFGLSDLDATGSSDGARKMNEAIIVSLDRAEEALGLAANLTDVSSQQLELCREIAQKVEIAGEIEFGSLRELIRLQTEVRKIRILLKAVAEPIDS
jgi:hypothetical protein